MVDQVCHRPGPRRAFRPYLTVRAVDPPLKVRGLFKVGEQVVFISKPVGIEKADNCQRIGEVI